MAESMVETETNKSRERSKWNGNGQDRFPRRRDHVGDNGVAILPLGWISGFFLSLSLSPCFKEVAAAAAAAAAATDGQSLTMPSMNQ